MALLEFRVIPVLDREGVQVDTIDDTGARRLLKRKVAIAVWGYRNIVAIKVSDPDWFDWDAAASPAYEIGKAECLITEDGARWPSIFQKIPMRPSVTVKVDTPEKPSIPLQRKLFVVPRRRNPLSGLPLAA